MRGILWGTTSSVWLDTLAPLTDFDRVMYGGCSVDGSERGGAEQGTDGEGADGVSDGGSDASFRSASELDPAAC